MHQPLPGAESGRRSCREKALGRGWSPGVVSVLLFPAFVPDILSGPCAFVSKSTSSYSTEIPEGLSLFSRSTSSQHCWRRGDNRISSISITMEVYIFCEGKQGQATGDTLLFGQDVKTIQTGQPAIEPVGKTTVTPPLVFSSWPDSPVLAFQRLPTSHQESQGGEQLPRSSGRSKLSARRVPWRNARMASSPRHQFQSG